MDAEIERLEKEARIAELKARISKAAAEAEAAEAAARKARAEAAVAERRAQAEIEVLDAEKAARQRMPEGAKGGSIRDPPKHHRRFVNLLSRSECFVDVLSPLRADPLRNYALQALAKATFLWDALSTSESSASARSTAQSKFRDALLSAEHGAVPQNSSTVRCFLLDKPLPNVVAAHIVPRRCIDAGCLCSDLFGSDFDVASPRNGLLLYKSLEHAFDRGQLCFLKIDGKYIMRVLDPTLRNVNVVQRTKDIMDAARGKTSRVFVDVSDGYISRLTFGDLDGATLRLPANFSVSNRALCFQAKWSTARARSRGFPVDFADYWSDGVNLELMERFLSDALTAVEVGRASAGSPSQVAGS